MNITSSFKRDFPFKDKTSGGYEWWYYDAVSNDGLWSFVIIFYDGCPFSPKYNQSLVTETPSKPSSHPAISISIYREGKPMFYSMSEYPKGKSSFEVNNNVLSIQIGNNQLHAEKKGNKIVQTLSIQELLPSKDQFRAELTFESIFNPKSLFPEKDEISGHGWNLTMPKSTVSGSCSIISENNQPINFDFIGNGYHDHNLGQEPMKDEFIDWYWGRFHLKNSTLIYYLMRTKMGMNNKAWIVDDSGKIANTLNEAALKDFSSNVFLLSAARTIELGSTSIEASIHQAKIVDSGPFYYRYLSDIIVYDKITDTIETAQGITEYIKPARIHSKLFWPLVHMRYRYIENSHWVQKSPTMYKWTW